VNAVVSIALGEKSQQPEGTVLLRRLLLSFAGHPFLALGLICGLTSCKRPPESAAPAPSATVEEKPIAPGDVKAAEALRELTPIFDKALTAYNAGDRAALFADFATTATPAPSERIFQELFEGYYKKEFGRLTALRLYPQETVPDADYGMLVYLAQCERNKIAKVSANFIRENGAPKIVQIRIEKVDLPAK
jgi:hypothetical protein